MGRNDDIHGRSEKLHRISIRSYGVGYINHRSWLNLIITSYSLEPRMKALLYSLVSTFEFELAVPEERIETRSFVVQRPYIKNDGENEGPAVSRMPLMIKRYNAN